MDYCQRRRQWLCHLRPYGELEPAIQCAATALAERDQKIENLQDLARRQQARLESQEHELEVLRKAYFTFRDTKA